jgi:hypothetical protein
MERRFMKIALLFSLVGWATILVASLILSGGEKTIGALFGGGISTVDIVLLYLVVARVVQSKGSKVIWLGLVVLKFLVLLTVVGVVVLLVKMDIVFFSIALGLIPVSMLGASLKLAMDGSISRE